MRLKVLIFSGALAFFAPEFISAQTTADDIPKVSAEAGKAKIGTYQFVISVTKSEPVFSDEILFEIEQKRDENEIVYLDVAPGVRVTILPRKTINAPGFVPLPEVVHN